MMRPIRLRWAMTAILLAAVSTTMGDRLMAASPADSGDGPPNILWLITEDMGPDLGCYGTPEVATPHLDQLASQGVRYTHAYTTAPVCSASRSAFCTGMYQTSIGAHNHRSHRNDDYWLPQGVRVITDWLREADYFTANIGRRSRPIAGTGKTDWNFAYHSQHDKPFDSNSWADLKSHQPFYAQINFSESHRRFSAPQRADPAKVAIPPYYPDHPVTRADWAAYLDEVSEADRKIGRVLEQLEAEGLADKTVVIFFGDHGRAMIRSKQWPYDSGLHIPLIIRWPKGYPLPERFKPGMVDNRLIASIDITATTLSIAGIEPPRLMQGRPFIGPHADLDRQYVFGGRDRGDETVDRIRTVRDDRYRYLRNDYPDRPFLQQNLYKERSYPVIALMRKLLFENKLTPVQRQLMAATRPPEELYDLKNDPYETNNLCADADYHEALIRLRAALDTWIVETNDQGRYPESSEQVAPWLQREQKISQQWRKKNPEAYQLMLRHWKWWEQQKERAEPQGPATTALEADKTSVQTGINKQFLDPNLKVEDWLTRFEVESREIYAAREEILQALKLKPGMAVADIGAGTGLFTLLMNQQVGPQGWVYAVEISPRFLEHLSQMVVQREWTRVTPVLCGQRSIRLPTASLDMAFLCDVYHHFEYPRSSLASIHRALRPGGRLVVIDFKRIEGESRDWILGHVRAGQEKVQQEIEAAGFTRVREAKLERLRENYFLVFQKTP